MPSVSPALAGALPLRWPNVSPPAAGESAQPPCASQMDAFVRFVEGHGQRRFPDYVSLHAWSVAEYREFWAAFLQWTGPLLSLAGEAGPVCVGDEVEHARFFPLLQLSYADSVLNLRVAAADAPALTECHADGTVRRFTRGQLRDEAARLALQLQSLGVREGDRVVAVLRNDARAAIAALAVTALGATLSTAAPDMGLQALQDRFGPLSPRLLLAHGGPAPGTDGPLPQLAALCRALTGLERVLFVDDQPVDLPEPVAALRIADLLPVDPASFDWPRFHFNHPLFILFSSGTTGRPKCIVHGVGGTLLEHVKEHRLHTDLKPGDRMYFHTSCGWMMWNWQLTALASGAEIVTYDGPVDRVDRLWELVAREKVTVFGTSPGYLRMGEEAGLVPSRLGLDALRAVLSTGAVLHDGQFHWVASHAKDVPVQSVSGGTDILGCFVLGHPGLPVRAGEAQCRSLGLDVQAWDEGRPATGIGQLVCASPFPSRPLGFHGDEDGSRFHAAYFSQNPGAWTHGDLIEFSPEGGARLHGRCDGVLNVRGIKFHPGEVYRALAGLPGLLDVMLVTRTGAPPQVVALLVLAPGQPLDAPLAQRIRATVREQLSAAHVPDLLLDVPELPATHNGKFSEAAARAAVNGETAANLAALRNPACLDAIRRHPALQAVEVAPAVEGTGLDALCATWAAALRLPTVEPDDDFFALGGNSLVAARLLRGVQDRTGTALPLSALLQAPTPRALARLLEGADALDSPLLVRMRDGVGAPLFLVHGLSGTVMECWSMVKALHTGRPVWGLQAPGLSGESAPVNRVEPLAQRYVEAIRKVQPSGPYAVCGFSFGGLVAYEMARQLAAQGQRVQTLVLLDPYLRVHLPFASRWKARLAQVARRFSRMDGAKRIAYARGRLRGGMGALMTAIGIAQPARASDDLQLPPAQARVYDSLSEALGAYRPGPWPGDALFVHAQEVLAGYLDSLPAWQQLVARLRVVELPGEHLALVGVHASRVAALIDAALDAVGV